jgi:hypothetical protein
MWDWVSHQDTEWQQMTTFQGASPAPTQSQVTLSGDNDGLSRKRLTHPEEDLSPTLS